MAKIEISIDYDQDMTVFKITGILNAGELLESTKRYNAGKVTKLVLVDFTDATWTGLSAAELRKNTARAITYSNKDGKSAFVFSSDADFGIGRMVETFAAIEKSENRFHMFRSFDEANHWLRTG